MKQALTAQSQRGNQKARQNGDLSHLAVRAVTDYEMPSGLRGASTSHSGHDFSQAAVRPGAAMVGRDYGAASCPAFPRTCPFGGACHTCPARVQTKLIINEPGDKYEQEADRIADVVLRMPEQQVGLQRSCVVCDEELQRQPDSEEDEEEEILQTKGRGTQAIGVTDDVEDLIQNMQGRGRPLPGTTRSFFESRFGHSFDQVRVHSGSRANEAARAVNARAYTLGQDIVFGAGEYSPGTMSGMRLLAHELVHVVQQRRSKGPADLGSIQRAPPPSTSASCPNTVFYIHLDLPWPVTDRYFRNGVEQTESVWQSAKSRDQSRPNSCEIRVSRDIEIPNAPDPTINAYLLYTRSPCCRCFLGSVSWDVAVDGGRQTGSQPVGACSGETCCNITMTVPLALSVAGHSISGTVSVSGGTYLREE